MNDDHWDVIRFVRLYARCRSPDPDEQKDIERHLLEQRIPFPFQEMISTIRNYRENESGAVDQWAIDHPHQRSMIAQLRQKLPDMQVLVVLRTLEATHDRSSHQDVHQDSRQERLQGHR